MHKIRIPKSAIPNRELPARFNDSRDLALKRQVAKRYARNAKLAKVTARSSRLRTSVANTDRAPIAGHLLQQYHRRVDLGLLMIFFAAFRRSAHRATRSLRFSFFTTLLIFAISFRFLVPCFWFLVLEPNLEPGTRNSKLIAGKAFPRISKAIVPDRRSSPS